MGSSLERKSVDMEGLVSAVGSRAGWGVLGVAHTGRAVILCPQHPKLLEENEKK